MSVHGGVCNSEEGCQSTPPGGAGSGNASGGAGGADKFVDNGGLVLSNVHVYLIFWGNAWTQVPTSGGTPATVGNVMAATRSIVTGPYMSGLHQYRSIGRGQLAGASLVNTAFGSSTAEPPAGFTDTNVSDLLSNMLDAQVLPAPGTFPDMLYVVIMPPGISSANTSFIGEHTYYTLNGTNIHFSWITQSGSLDSVTPVLSHEIVESCTDPEGSAFLGVAGTCSQGGWCEIGDVCGTTGRVDGVLVQSYYSNVDGDCIIPDAAYAKREKENSDTKLLKDNKDHKEIKEHKDNKDNKEHKDFKDHKESKEAKEQKDRKDHKENKEGAKDFKEKDAKEKDNDSPADLRQLITEVSQRLTELGQRLADQPVPTVQGQAFIKKDERPDVGGRVYDKS